MIRIYVLLLAIGGLVSSLLILFYVIGEYKMNKAVVIFYGVDSDDFCHEYIHIVESENEITQESLKPMLEISLKEYEALGLNVPEFLVNYAPMLHSL